MLLRGRLLTVAVIGIVVASVVRIVATGPFEYFSTVTRADAILVGAVVALIRPRWHPRELRDRPVESLAGPANLRATADDGRIAAPQPISIATPPYGHYPDEWGVNLSLRGLGELPRRLRLPSRWRERA